MVPNDPRLWIAAAAGALRADQAWRKAPCQCPILVETMKGAPSHEIIELIDTWTLAYRSRCHEYEQAALS